jgi:hypothetical protein
MRVSLALVAVVVMSGTVRAENLIVNGDFNLAVPNGGFANGWLASGNDSAGGWRIDGGNPDGRYIMNASGSDTTDPSIMQIVLGLTPGERYLVTGDFFLTYASSGSFSAKSFGVRVDGDIVFEASRDEISETAWNAFSAEFVAGSTQAIVSIAAERNGTDYGYSVDNITMTVIPVPASLAVVGIGGIAAARRRR